MTITLGAMKAQLPPGRREAIERRANEIESQIKNLQALRVAGASTQVEVCRLSPYTAGKCGEA